MPMSNLQRQLASLHGNSRSATYASTHHQIESIGRGYGYENQLGHTTVQSATKKDKSKPTLVYETSRAAADVPLITIRENAHKALQDLIHLLSFTNGAQVDESTLFDARARYLKDHAPTFFDHSTLKQERRLNTPAKNEEMDQQLCELLIVLGGCFDDNSSAASGGGGFQKTSHPYDDDDEDDNTTPDDRAESSAITTRSTSSHGQCILYMLEYLIRRYEIHTRSKTANQLLISFLPQHETILFGRLLQLVDLPMVDGNTWLFARRFAAVGSNHVPIVMTRQIIAQAMATPTNKGALLSNILITTQSLIRIVATSSSQHPKVQKDEDEAQLWTMGQQRKKQQSQTPMGINQFLSFVGAVVSEALMHQAHDKTTSSSNGGLLDESTVRIVMPFIMDTLDSNYLNKCREYRHLGYVLIGILANCSILVKGAREVLASTMIKPITMTFQKQMKQLTKNEDGGDKQLVVASSADPQSLLLFRQRLVHDEMCQQLVDCFMVLNRLSVYGQREKENSNLLDTSHDDDGTTTSMIGSPSSSTSFVGIPLLAIQDETNPYSTDSLTTTTYLLGCSLPRSTYLALCQGGTKLLQDALNMAIGSSSPTEEDDYSFLLAAMVRYSMTYMMEHTNKSNDNASSQKSNNGLRYGLDVFLALCGATGAASDSDDYSSDLQSIWFHRTNLTASVTILLLQEYMKSQSSTAAMGNKHDKKKKKKKKKNKKHDSNEHSTMDDNDDDDDDEQNNEYYKTLCLERCSKCLGALYKLDSDGCNRGIATVVTSQQQQASSKSKSKKKESHRLQRLIRRTFGGMFQDSRSGTGDAGGEEESTITTNNDDETRMFMADPFLKSLFVKKKKQHHSTQEEWANLLPPRVALDHPEETVRLGAIQRIMIFKSKPTPTAGDKHTADDDDDDQNEGAEVDLEREDDFPSLLLQRVVKDSSARVVAAAGKAYQFLVGQAEMTNVTNENEEGDDTTSTTTLCRLPTAREALVALERWGWLMDDRANDVSAEFTSPQTKKEMKRYHRGTASAHDNRNNSMDALTEDDVTALCVVIDLCALATDHSETTNEEYDLLVLGMVGHLNCFGQNGFLDDGYDMNLLNKLVSSLRNGYDQLQITISRALHRIVEHEEENNDEDLEEEDGNDVVKQSTTTNTMEEDIPMEVLLSTKDLFAVVLQGVLQSSSSTTNSNSSKFHSILKRRFIRVMLSATVHYLEDDHTRPTRIIKSKRTIAGSSKEKDDDAIVVDTCLDICFYLVQQYNQKNEESTTTTIVTASLPPDILSRCFKACMIKPHSLKQVLMMKLLKERPTTTLQPPGPLDIIAYFWNVIALAIPDPSLNSTISISTYQDELMNPLFPLLVTHVFDLKNHSINDQSSIMESAKETIVLELCTRSSNLQPFAIVTLLRFLKGNGGSYQQSFQQRHPLSSSSSQEDDHRYNSLRFMSLVYLCCGHTDRLVRSEAIEFFTTSTSTLMQTTSNNSDDGTILVRTIIRVITQEMKSKLVLDGGGGSNIMGDVLRSILESNGVDAVPRNKRQCLFLQLCTNVLGVDQQQQTLSSPCTFYGLYHICHWILQTLIQSGICDKSDMWTTAGKPILDYFRTTEHSEMISLLDKKKNEEEGEGDTSSSWSDMKAKSKYDLFVLVVMMLKGVVVVPSTAPGSTTDMVSMTLGPARGRSRSYSIIEEVKSSAEEKKVTVLNPYPTSMMETILECLQDGLNASTTSTRSSASALRQFLSNIVLEKIVASQTWSTLIFPNIPNNKHREQLLLLILNYREQLNDPLAARALTVLPLVEDDFINLLTKLSSQTGSSSSSSVSNLLTMVYLCECISRRVPTMMDYTKLTTLMELLFSEFQMLSKKSSTNQSEVVVATANSTTSSDVEYCRFCILKSLLDLGRQLQQQNVEDPPSAASPKRKRSRSRSRSRSESFSTSTPNRGNTYTKFASMLLHVLELPSTSTDDKMIPLQTPKARYMAVSLFLIMCQLDPPYVGPLMLRALTNVTDLIVSSTTGVDYPSPQGSTTTTTLITSNAVSDIVRTYISLQMKWQAQSHSSSPSETAGVVHMNDMLASFSWHVLMPLYKAMDSRRTKNKMRLNSNVITTADAAAMIVSDEDDNTMEEDDVSDLLSDILDQWIVPMEEATDTTATNEVNKTKSINHNDVGEALSSLCASLVAIESYYTLYEGTTGAFDLLPLMIDKVLGMTSTSQVSTAFCLLRRVGNLIQALLLSKNCSDKDTNKEESMSPTKEGTTTKKKSNKKSSLFSMSTRSLIHIVCHDGNKEPLPSVSLEDRNDDDEENDDFGDIEYISRDTKKRRCVMLLVTRLLSLGQNLLFSTDVKTMIRRDDTSARMCFVLWRQLMYVLSQTQSYSSFLLQQSLQQKKQKQQASEESDEVLVQLERSFWNGASVKMDECLLLLQRLLPVPHFLTSAMSVICDEFLETAIRRKALLLLVERAIETEPGSSECCLFLESIPTLLDIVCPSRSSSSATKNADTAKRPQSVSIQQSVLMTIERLARHLSSPYNITSTTGGGSKVVTKHESTILHDTLDRLSVFVSTTVESFVNNVNQLSSSSGTRNFDIKHINDLQLMSSSLLCSATILGVLGPRALSTLKSMMKSIVQILKTISSYYQWSSGEVASSRKNDDEVISLLLESTLRALTALFQAVPQFLGSYLNDLLQCTALGSSMLRRRTNDDDNDATVDTSLKTQFENVEHAFATNIPVRQSCPAICNNILKTIQQQKQQHDSFRKHNTKESSSSSSWKDICVLLRLLTLTIQNATKADMSPVMSKSIGAIMTAATYHEDSSADEDKGRFEVLQSSSEALVALVMKLSESQLKPLFLRMREWKGDLIRTTKASRSKDVNEDNSDNDDFDEEDIMASSVRRYAFWTITARLTTEIRSLFLPCLSTVVTDLVDELTFTSSMMKKKNHLGTSSSKKKRRKLSSGSFEEIGDNDGGETSRLALEQLRPLQPVLLTLEAAMKADAHAGGGWIRVEDGTRFQSLLTPLSKLFLVHVPTDMPLEVAHDDEELVNSAETTNAYDKLVRGVGTLDYGNVVGCITAMATAVGNEQMWKPLNHAILSACGNEERREVCKAGITALLTVLRTIGEEYMVLLPESLPVLSELLEHADDDIASMAKECIELGEEMLGESFDM